MSEGEVRGLATPGSRVKVLWRHPEESEGAAGLGVRREPLGLCREGSHSSHLGGPLNNSDPPKTWRKIPCLRALHHYHVLLQLHNTAVASGKPSTVGGHPQFSPQSVPQPQARPCRLP